MDMQTGTVFDSPAQTKPREGLTFHWLYERVQELVERSIYPKAGRLEKWSFRVGMLAAVIGILSSQLPDRWLPVSVVLPLVIVCLAVEIGGFIVGGILAARR